MAYEFRSRLGYWEDFFFLFSVVQIVFLSINKTYQPKQEGNPLHWFQSLVRKEQGGLVWSIEVPSHIWLVAQFSWWEVGSRRRQLGMSMDFGPQRATWQRGRNRCSNTQWLGMAKRRSSWRRMVLERKKGSFQVLLKLIKIYLWERNERERKEGGGTGSL